MVSNIFLFSPLFGEMIQFDEHIFEMGWFNHQLDKEQKHEQTTPNTCVFSCVTLLNLACENRLTNVQIIHFLKKLWDEHLFAFIYTPLKRKFTLPETNIAHENPIIPGKYHQNGGFSMAMLVSGSVIIPKFCMSWERPSFPFPLVTNLSFQLFVCPEFVVIA